MNIRISASTYFYIAIRSFWKSFSNFGVIIAILALMVAVINFLHAQFGVPLYGITRNLIETLHYAAHIFFSTILLFIPKAIVYVSEIVMSFIFNFIPMWPNINIPRWYSDLAIISMGLTRAFDGADLIVPSEERKSALTGTNANSHTLIYDTEGPLWGRVHKFIEYVNKRIWRFVNSIEDKMPAHLRRCESCKSAWRIIIIYTAGGIFMWGFIRFFGYAINIKKCFNLDLPIIKVRKKLFTMFLLILFTSVIGAMLCIYLSVVFEGY